MVRGGILIVERLLKSRHKGVQGQVEEDGVAPAHLGLILGRAGVGHWEAELWVLVLSARRLYLI